MLLIGNIIYHVQYCLSYIWLKVFFCKFYRTLVLYFPLISIVACITCSQPYFSFIHRACFENLFASFFGGRWTSFAQNFWCWITMYQQGKVVFFWIIEVIWRNRGVLSEQFTKSCGVYTPLFKPARSENCSEHLSLVRLLHIYKRCTLLVYTQTSNINQHKLAFILQAVLGKWSPHIDYTIVHHKWVTCLIACIHFLVAC